MMSPRDLFGVALRVLGIWFLTIAAYRGVILIFAQEKYPGGISTPDKLLVGLYLLIALILLAGANGIVRLCYRPDKQA